MTLLALAFFCTTLGASGVAAWLWARLGHQRAALAPKPALPEKSPSAVETLSLPAKAPAAPVLSEADRVRETLAIAERRGRTLARELEEAKANGDALSEALKRAEEAQTRAEEAQKRAEEQARVARDAKVSFSGEVKLLREEIARLRAPEKRVTSIAPPEKNPTARTGTWWCQLCGRGGVIPDKNCCAHAR